MQDYEKEDLDKILEESLKDLEKEKDLDSILEESFKDLEKETDLDSILEDALNDLKFTPSKTVPEKPNDTVLTETIMKLPLDTEELFKKNLESRSPSDFSPGFLTRAKPKTSALDAAIDNVLLADKLRLNNQGSTKNNITTLLQLTAVLLENKYYEFANHYASLTLIFAHHAKIVNEPLGKLCVQLYKSCKQRYEEFQQQKSEDEQSQEKANHDEIRKHIPLPVSPQLIDKMFNMFKIPQGMRATALQKIGESLEMQFTSLKK